MTDTINDEIERIEFSVERSLRYHTRRRAFLDACHKWIMAAIIVGGSTAFVGILGSWPIIGKVAAGLLTVLAALDLVFDVASRARDHEVLYRRFSELGRRITSALNPSAELLAELRMERLRIEADEPPIFRALDVSCHNEMIQAWGIDAGRSVPLSWRGPLKNILRFSSASFPSYDDLAKKPPHGPRYPAQAE